MIWRVVVSEPTRGQSYHEIVEHWSLNDLDDANCVITAIENGQVRSQRAAEAARPRTPTKRR